MARPIFMARNSATTPGVHEAAQGQANGMNRLVGKSGLDSIEIFPEEYST
jgi:hypothetical protein